MKAVTGGLAGFLCGLNDMPPTWINQLARKDAIKNVAERLAGKLSGH